MSQATKNFEEKCKQLFFEANSGNPITVGQLAKIIRKACPTYKGTDADIAQTFLEMDADNNKLVSWDEFLASLYEKEPKEVTRAELELAFKSIDKDGSGKLDKSEIRRLCHEQGLNITEDALNELMEEADPNGDGVNFEEFLASWACGN